MSKRAGFTLVSTLVAIILLAVGLTTLAGASSNTIKMQTLAQNRTNAIALARAYMETVRTRDPWTVVSESPVQLNADGTASSSGAFIRTLTVAVTRQDLLRIDVAVSYPRATQPVTITTSFFRGNSLVAP
jgi:type IV pilus assembly protein PilV